MYSSFMTERWEKHPQKHTIKTFVQQRRSDDVFTYLSLLSALTVDEGI